MAIHINIDEDKIDNFSDGAQVTLKKQMGKYADDIIKEANLIEEAIRENGANTEITSDINVITSSVPYMKFDLISLKIMIVKKPKNI